MSEEKRIVKSYEEEMQSLNDDLVKMGSLTESQLSDTIQAIVKIDKEAAENIIKNDVAILDDGFQQLGINNHLSWVLVSCMSSILRTELAASVAVINNCLFIKADSIIRGFFLLDNFLFE